MRKNSQRFTLMVLLTAALCLTLAFSVPAAFATTQDAAIQSQESIPVYNPPLKNTEILRREGGDIGVSRSMTRSLIRGLTRGLTRSFTRSLARGENRGLSRSLNRGLTRSLNRGLTRSENRGLTRSLNRGEDRGLTRNENRSMTRSENRSLTRAEIRSLTRSLTHTLTQKEAELIPTADEQAQFSDLIEPDDVQKISGDVPLPKIIAPIAALQTGYTTKSQPVLNWYISGEWNGEIEITLNEYGKIEPVLETHITGPSSEGIYQIDLADYDITLKPDTDYEWFVAIVPFPKERSADFIASAAIKYVKPSDSLSGQLANTPENELYLVYAHEGYWYDAIEQLCRMIDEKPKDNTLRAHRVHLLEQVKLGKVIDYDKKQL